MVRGALLRDALREISKTRSRFLAILVIVAIGTAFFVGIKTTGPDMRITADRYYRDSAFMDFRLLSTVGFDDADVAAIRATPGVRGVMPAYQVDALMTIGKRERVIRILSLPADGAATVDSINRPYLANGRLPSEPGECVIERNGMVGLDMPIGARITLSSGTEAPLSDSLAHEEYTIVGIVDSPLYLAKDRGTTTLGNGMVAAFMLVADEEFKLPVHTAVYVTADLPANVKAYSKQYDDQIAPIEAALKATATDRQTARQGDIRREAEDLLAAKETEYETAARQTRAQLAAAAAELARGRQELTAGQATLATQRQAYEQGIAAGQAKLDAARAELTAGEQQYAAGLAQLQAAGMTASQAQVQLTPQRAQLDAAAAELARGEQELAAQKQQGQEGLATAQAELTAAEAKLVAGERQQQAGAARAESELAAGRAKLDEARAKLADLPAVEWYVLGRGTNSGYVDYKGATERMDAIATVFPVIFVLVAILICFTSMSRMVEEQRSFIGTAKALGYGTGPIAAKFLLYGALAAIVGCAIGLAVGFTVMPTNIFRAYSMLYTLPRFIRIFDVPFALAALVVSLAVTTISALFVCRAELRSNAANLLRPRAPQAGKRVWLERITPVWRRLGFTQKVTARNLIRYRSRFYMTVVGVAGCTALLLVGLGLNDALQAIGTKQFGDINAYEMTIGLASGVTPGEMATLQQTIEAQSGYVGSEKLMTRSIDIRAGSKEKTVGLIVPSDTARIPEFIKLRERVGHLAVTLTDDGVVLTEKAAAQLGIRIGDQVAIKHNDQWQITTTVTATCENYLLHYVYMSPALYQRLYGQAPDYNQVVVRLNAPVASQEASATAILALPGVTGVGLVADSLGRFSDIIQSIGAVFVVLIVAAAILSFTVLYTLTTINITERQREIATIKVLGFYNHEVAGFVLRENFILALIGALVGLIFGTGLARYVIGTAEIDMVMFGRQILPLSYAIAAALTLVFTGLVNLVMVRPLSQINMIEALKTVE